jgi:3-phosphoshikimate 1-carboxyvinyltransferase
VTVNDDARSDGLERFVVAPGQRVGGEIEVPGDKSISHRSLMLGALADGPTTVHGFLEGDDCVATRRALEQLGVEIAGSGTTLIVEGSGPDGLCEPAAPLDLGNSGTGIRLLMGLLAGRPFASELTGDASLRRRPMERVAEPLRRMGAHVETTGGNAPVRMRGARLTGIDYALPVASAQIKSALLLAALQAHGPTTLVSPGPSRDHTEKMLLAMGAAVDVDPAGRRVSVLGPARLSGTTLFVPGDLSSAAFFIVAACLAADSGLLIRNVGMNSTRTGIIGILERMGARIELRNARNLGNEPVADVFVRKSRLRGTTVPPELVPLAIDEFPVLFVAAAAAEGRTVVTGAAELRHKESDRIGIMARALETLGVRVTELPDGLEIQGGGLDGGTIDSHGDHRVAMAFAVGSLASRGPIEILGTREVATSFPGFVDVAARAGLEIAVHGGPK